MKKRATLGIVLVLIFSIKMRAQGNGDITTILQKCIDLPELEQLYPVNSDGSHKPVYVLQHGVSFPENTAVSKFGKRVQFVNKGQLNSENIGAYFLFWEYKIDQDIANIDFVYNLNNADGNPKSVRVILTMRKSDGLWSIVNTKTEGR
jgi:hypothetical protein